MKEKFYIGINFGFNASACLVSNEKGIIAAISQERLNGEKNTKKLPIDAVVKCCEIANVKKVESVVYSHYQTLSIDELFCYADELSRSRMLLFPNLSAEELFVILVNYEGIEVNDKKMQRVEHHTAHEFSAFGIYGKQDKYVSITSDGFGDGISGRITINDGKKEKVISEVKVSNSVALVYQFVTGALGYKMHQHEGKITGLAAFGKPKYFYNLLNLFEINNDDFGNFLNLRKENAINLLTDEDLKLINSNWQIKDFKDFQVLKKSVFKLIDDLKEENALSQDIAASVQEFAEKVTINWIKEKLYNILENKNLLGKIPCYLAGGLFANVKLNQRVHETKMFSNVYVAPPMGDEGTCVGAVLKVIYDNENKIVNKKNITENVFVGTKIERYEKEVYNFLNLDKNKSMCSFDIYDEDEMIEKIADSLANKKIVCFCKDRMEFGPRALCHRSILYDCTDATVNDWLNKQLGRTEFMPFAPVMHEKHFKELFENTNGAEDTSRFMTITFDCKDEFVLNYPAACHVDNTARPQIVNEETDLYMSKILEKYEKKTKKKVLINTSFNLHNYPIIEDPFIAISSWLKSNTDILIIGNFFIKRR